MAGLRAGRGIHMGRGRRWLVLEAGSGTVHRVSSVACNPRVTPRLGITGLEPWSLGCMVATAAPG